MENVKARVQIICMKKEIFISFLANNATYSLLDIDNKTFHFMDDFSQEKLQGLIRWPW